MKPAGKYLIFFGIFFIIGGMISVIAESWDYFRLKTAKNVQIVESRIISLETDSEWNYKAATDSAANIDERWLTKEEMLVDGRIINYQGSYTYDPEGSVFHTLISDDGVNWEVNNSSGKNLIVSSAAGLVTMAIGIILILFSARKLKK